MNLHDSSCLILVGVGMWKMWTSGKFRFSAAFEQTNSRGLIRGPLGAVDNCLETIHSTGGSGIVSVGGADLVAGVHDG
jgi:hypothetical protein